MNTRLKIFTPLCIIFVTLASAILAGSRNENKLNPYQNTEVLARTPSKQEVLTKAKPRILNIIDSNISDSTKYNKDTVRIELQNYMEQYDKGKDQEFRILLERKLQDLQEIIHMEQKEYFREMSLDARTPATKILTDICEQYGMGITYGVNGDIVMLRGMSGEYIFENEMAMESPDLRLEVLLGIMIAITGFIIICIYIAKKKQLFIKDGIYDGYNKEGFA